MAIGRLIAVPRPDEVPVDLSAVSPCEVIRVEAKLGMMGSITGSPRLPSTSDHSVPVTTREFATIKGGGQLPLVSPRGSCNYVGEAGTLAVSFRAQWTTPDEAPEIIGRASFETYGITPAPRALPPVDGAAVWEACPHFRPRPNCSTWFILDEPYFFVIEQRTGEFDAGLMRAFAVEVLEALRSAR
jgi:hypothetical protein